MQYIYIYIKHNSVVGAQTTYAGEKKRKIIVKNVAVVARARGYFIIFSSCSGEIGRRGDEGKRYRRVH